MLHLVNITMNIPRDELGLVSRKLRDRVLHDIIPKAGGLTVICQDGIEIDLGWANGRIEYNGCRSTLRHHDRKTTLPEELSYLIGRRLDSFQFADQRGYLVMNTGDVIQLECGAEGNVTLTPAKAGYRDSL